MSEQQTRPHCGAERRFDYPKYYECGTDAHDAASRYTTCYERQIAAQAAEIESLKKALVGTKRAVQTWAHYPEVK